MYNDVQVRTKKKRAKKGKDKVLSGTKKQRPEQKKKKGKDKVLCQEQRNMWEIVGRKTTAKNNMYLNWQSPLS